MKHILAGVGLLFCADALAISVPSGQGALLYDAQSTTGPGGKLTNSPGHWKDNISAFNAGATTADQITRLYPYSGDIEMNCTGPSDCFFSGAGQNVFVYYDPPAFGKASVAAYRAAFPTALILAIIDGSTKSKLLAPLSYTEIGTQTADLTAQTICADANVDGVFFDLEPADFSVPGQAAFYKEISKQFSSSGCMDGNHPNGRVFAVFANPNKVSDWGPVAAGLGNNGYIAVTAYDVKDRTPPLPIAIQGYHASITGMLEKMDAASRQYKIPYTVVIPAAATFGEFQELGIYDPSNPPTDFKLQQDFAPAITQLGYVQSVRNIILATCKSPYFLGRDFWKWAQYTYKDGKLLMPDIPNTETVQYLQKN